MRGPTFFTRRPPPTHKPHPMTASISPVDPTLAHEIAHGFIVSLSRLGLFERTTRIETLVRAGAAPGLVSRFVRYGWPHAFGNLIPHDVIWSEAGSGIETLRLTARDVQGAVLLTRTYGTIVDVGLALQEDDGLPGALAFPNG